LKWSRQPTPRRQVILEGRRDIRVVFTDVHLPGSMEGLKLAHAVRDRWPPIHMVATSAYFATVDVLPWGSMFVPKPLLSAG
jgi:two-component system, response regulator PdtaR